MIKSESPNQIRAQAWSFYDYIIKTNLILDDVGKFQQINPVGNNDNPAKIKSFIILAVLRRSVKRVDGAHLRVIAHGQHSFLRRNIAA